MVRTMGKRTWAIAEGIFRRFSPTQIFPASSKRTCLWSSSTPALIHVKPQTPS